MGGRGHPLRREREQLNVTARKYGNVKVGGFDSRKEAVYGRQLELQKRVRDARLRVVKIERQVPFLLIPTQRDGLGRLLEKLVQYKADFRVTYADGHSEVVDVKSPITRMLPAYVLKRKLMLQVHGIRVIEV